MTTKPKFKIADLRNATNRLSWLRNDFGGSTLREQMTMDLTSRISGAFLDLANILPAVPARFASDIDEALRTLDRASVGLVRWAIARANWENLSEDDRHDASYLALSGHFVHLEDIAPETLDKIRLGASKIMEHGWEICKVAAAKAQEAEELPANCVPFRKMA